MQPMQQVNRISIEKCHIYEFSFAFIDETRYIVLETIPLFGILTSTSNKIRLFIDLLDHNCAIINCAIICTNLPLRIRRLNT